MDRDAFVESVSTRSLITDTGMGINRVIEHVGPAIRIEVLHKTVIKVMLHRIYHTRYPFTASVLATSYRRTVHLATTVILGIAPLAVAWKG
jgi:hypothetical protein